MDFEETQTVLFKVEAILNNRLLSYYYYVDGKESLTSIHLLFGRQPKLFNLEPFEISCTPADLNAHVRKINNIINHFCDRWKKEYLINPRKHPKVKLQKFNRPQILLKDVVTLKEKRQSRSMWRVGIVEKLPQGKDGQIPGANGGASGVQARI